MSTDPFRSSQVFTFQDAWEAVSITEREAETAHGVVRLDVRRERETAYLSWEVPRTRSISEEAIWRVERSGSTGGPFEHVGTAASEDRSWRDDAVPRGLDRSRYLFYRLILQDGESETAFGYNPEHDLVNTASRRIFGRTWGPRGERSALAPGEVRQMRQMFHLLLQSNSGSTYFAYRPRWDRGSCPACTNAMTGTRDQITGDSCKACSGSGYEGGYYPPQPTVGSRYTRQVRKILSPVGYKDHKEDGQLLLPFWPPIQVDDILRRPDGSLFTVVSLDEGDLFEYPAIQVAQITQIDRHHPLNDVPPPEDPRARHFERYMNLEAISRTR